MMQGFETHQLNPLGVSTRALEYLKGIYPGNSDSWRLPVLLAVEHYPFQLSLTIFRILLD